MCASISLFYDAVVSSQARYHHADNHLALKKGSFGKGYAIPGVTEVSLPPHINDDVDLGTLFHSVQSYVPGEHLQASIMAEMEPM